MKRKIIIGFLALAISALNFFSVNSGSVDTARAMSKSTTLYATKGLDTTSISWHYLDSSELDALKEFDSQRYQIKGRWNKYITEWDKLELSKFKPESGLIPDYANIEEVFLHGMWQRDNNEIKKAWVTIISESEVYTTNVYAPDSNLDSPISVNLTSFLNTPTKLINAKIRFQAQSKNALPFEDRVVTLHNEFQLRVTYNDQTLSNGTVYDAPDTTYPKYFDHEWSRNTDKIAVSWNNFTGAEINKYKVALGTSVGANDVCSFTDVGLETFYEFTDSNPNCSAFPLLNEQEYFFTVKAYTNKPCYSYSVSSNGITIDSGLPMVDIIDPTNGANVKNTFAIAADAWDTGSGVAKVEFQLNNLSLECYDALGNTYSCGTDGYYFSEDNDGSDGWTASFDSLKIPDHATYNLKARVTDNVGHTNFDEITIHTNNAEETDEPTNPTGGGEIIATSTIRQITTTPAENLSNEVEDTDVEEDTGDILGTAVDKNDEQKEETETKNYTGWIYLLLLYILILLGYYYYYLRDEYTAWFWIFPFIVGAILLFINNSLIKILDASDLAKLFWLWELIVFIIFVIYYQFFGRPQSEEDILKKYKITGKKKNN